MINVITWERAAQIAAQDPDREFIHLASTPHDEFCTQAGDNFQDQKIECGALINQLIRIYGEPPEGASFFIIENHHHEAGIYYEAGIRYRQQQETDAEDSQSEIYALKCEMIPDTWDEQSRQELREKGHSRYQPAKMAAGHIEKIKKGS